jgi:type I restriction enzyme, S subunit
MVPEGWAIKKLGDITVRSAFGPRFSSDLYDPNGNVGTIRTTDLDSEGKINYSTVPYASLQGFESHYLKDGDLLITRSGTCGIPSIFIEQEKPIIAGAFLIRFELNCDVIPRFVHQYLLTDRAKKDLDALASGGVQKNLSGTSLYTLDIPIPPKSEQRKILQILKIWEKSIEATEKLLANSKKRKNALMQQLLTGKKRLPGFNDEWFKKSLSDVAKIEMGSSPSSDAYNEHGIGLPLVQGNADIKNRKSSPRLFTSEITKEAFPGDILMSVRAPVGEVSISDHHCCIGRGVCSIKAEESCLDQDFLFQILLNLESSWVSISQGSTFESVNSKDIKNVQIQLPKPKEQAAIAEVLITADMETELIRRQVDFLKNEKTSLMQQLLTGKKRVKVEETV